MLRKLDQWTTALTAVLLVGALLACKKKEADTSAPTAGASAATLAATAPAASAPVAPEATAVGAKLGEVKRYPDKEKAQTGAARILQDGVKVFDEADDKTADVATLDKDLLVFRLASIPDYELVEFPSGVGKVSPGWVLSKFVDVKSAATVQREAVATQTKTAVVSSAAPKASAVASAAKPAASAQAAAAAASAQAAAAAASAQAAAAAASAQAAAAAAGVPLTKAQQIAARAAARAKANSKP